MEARRPSAQSLARQRKSGGDSTPAIHSAALEAASPAPGLTWLDIGCGRGDVLREIHRRHAPARLVGIDPLDWLEPDLRDIVEHHRVPAEDTLDAGPCDRVLMVETIEHLDAPWLALRAACELVAPGGCVVVTTPSIVTLRHRLELLLRGQLTSFRDDAVQHVTVALPHIIETVMTEAGMGTTRSYAGGDIIPWTGGRSWPDAVVRRAPSLTNVSVVVTGRRA